MVRRNSKNLATRNNSCTNTSAKKTQMGTGFVRIIAGKWRGRKIPVKNVQGLRPTTDSVKETVFNWLCADLYQARCLDVFAGSGSLGLEALSRQAEHVTFLELDKNAAKQIQENMITLDIDNATLYNTDAITYLSNQGKALPLQGRNLEDKAPVFDLVFIDPPFRKDLLCDVISHLEHKGWLADIALIYIEAEKELGVPDVPVHWEMLKEKHAGQVSYRLYKREKK